LPIACQLPPKPLPTRHFYFAENPTSLLCVNSQKFRIYLGFAARLRCASAWRAKLAREFLPRYHLSPGNRKVSGASCFRLWQWCGDFGRFVVTKASSWTARVLPSPQVERRPSNPEVSAGLSDVPDLLGVLDDSPFTLDFSLFGGQSDLLDHLASRRCQMVRLDLKFHTRRFAGRGEHRFSLPPGERVLSRPEARYRPTRKPEAPSFYISADIVPRWPHE
jgi:hypothetical protein